MTTEAGQKEVWAFTFNPDSPADSPYKVLYQGRGENLDMVWTPGTQLLVSEEEVWHRVPQKCWVESSPCNQADLLLYTDPIPDSWWPNYSPQWGG